MGSPRSLHPLGLIPPVFSTEAVELRESLMDKVSPKPPEGNFLSSCDPFSFMGGRGALSTTCPGTLLPGFVVWLFRYAAVTAAHPFSLLFHLFPRLGCLSPQSGMHKTPQLPPNAHASTPPPLSSLLVLSLHRHTITPRACFCQPPSQSLFANWLVW